MTFSTKACRGTAAPAVRRNRSAAQLYRTLLRLLLTPAGSSNLLCRLLPEQRAGQRFAHLPSARRCPDVRKLHEFPARLASARVAHCARHLGWLPQ